CPLLGGQGPPPDRSPGGPGGAGRWRGVPGEGGAFARELPDFALALMRAFWPAPLTLILPRRPEVAAVAAGGQDSVGLRCPSHPVAQAVLQAARRLGVQGVAAPSANRFGRVSPTTADHGAGGVTALPGAERLLHAR